MTVQYTLGPGECLISREPSRGAAVLGTHVAVTFFHHGLGAMLRVAAPARRGFGMGRSRGDARRSRTDQAFDFVLRQFKAQGVETDEITVKAFGGAEGRFPGEDDAGPGQGGRTIKIVIDAIQARGLGLAASDFGGRKMRKILFLAHTGVVYLKRLETVPPEGASQFISGGGPDYTFAERAVNT